ncbi:MAG: hypothetical protein EBT93_10235 [Alphaproteobacteria bacterium]|nr:hypothetical protein [Alphaproteobacteria bacterium]
MKHDNFSKETYQTLAGQSGLKLNLLDAEEMYQACCRIRYLIAQLTRGIPEDIDGASVFTFESLTND